MTWKKGIAAVLALCIAVMLISYYKPISVSAEYPVMKFVSDSREGPVEVQLDLTIHRRLITKDKVRGEVVFDGVRHELTNEYMGYTNPQSYGWGVFSPFYLAGEAKKRWREKTGLVYEAVWREPVYGRRIISVTVTKDFAYIEGFLPGEDPPYSFAGPARSGEELDAIYKNNPFWRLR